MEESQKPQGLIDFLYRDMSKIDSFFAQLYQGNINEVLSSSSQATSKQSQYDANAHFLRGRRIRKQENTLVVEQRIDPHDQKILDVVEALNISLLDRPISDVPNGQIILVHGQIVIRNYQAIKDAIPILFELSFSSNDYKQSKKKIEAQKNIFESMFSLIPLGLEMELITARNESIIGIIKPEYLTENPEDLLRIYGNYIPGDWYVLGIMNSGENIKSSTYSSEIKQSIDQFAEEIRQIFAQENDAAYVISPILIYRKLHF